MATAVTPSIPAAPSAPATPAPAPAAAPTPEPMVPKSVEDVMAKLTAPNPAYGAEEEPQQVVVVPSDPERQPAAAPEGAAEGEPPQATDLEEVPGETPPEGAPAEKPATEEPPTDQPPEFQAADGSTFRIKGPDGKYTKIPETLGQVEFTLGDKTYVKPIAELVQMSRRAVSLDRVVAQTKQEAERIQQEAQQSAALNQSFHELMSEVFSDESGEAFERRRAEFLRMTSPEARAERAETALQQRERLDREAAAQRAGMQWYAEKVEPFVAQAFTGAPDVSDEAKLGKLNLLTAHITVNGVVPPEHRAEFAQIVAGPFLEWSKQEQARMAGFKTAAQRKEQEAEAARRKAQEAVNAAGRGMAPVGKAAPDVPARTKPKNVNEALDLLIYGGAQGR